MFENPSSTDAVYRICTRCLMDSSIPGIEFSQGGDCNFCRDFLALRRRLPGSREGDAERLHELITKIKVAGQGKAYDCIVGVSGGVDSSWVLVKAVEAGLKPLAVHMDNGWDSELAQSNIFNLISSLDVDLFTYVIDWDEYRNLMRAFLAADVVDVELLYDNAMLAVNYRAAHSHGVRHILSGSNHHTEGMSMPGGWNWYKLDKRNIRGISHAFGGPKLKSFPAFGTRDYVQATLLDRISWVYFLDLFDFNKDDALNELESQFSYRRYQHKHYESVFTRFYQAYLLPRKFGIDKRRYHLSNLVASGQMPRDEAARILDQPPYESIAQFEADRDFFLRKIGWDLEDLEDYVSRSPVSHERYPNEYLMARRIRKVASTLRVTRMLTRVRS